MRSTPGVCSHRGCPSWLPVFVLLVATTTVLAQPQPPELTRPVNDFAGVIDADSARQMDSLIRSLQQTTGDVVAVAAIDSLGGEDIDQYAVKMFENHGKGIGQTGKDNGLLVLVAIKDRKVKIEVGYDLEQFITDGFAGETIREEMAPQFRRGAYGAGLDAAVTRIIGRIAEGRNVSIPAVPRTRSSNRGPAAVSGRDFIGVIFILFILINVIAGRLRRRGRRRWGGGPWSGWHSGVGPFGGGFGGFGGGGGGFGGGFGGFGGGRSGGGGASGSW